jgi:LacI family transcriptional regulator
LANELFNLPHPPTAVFAMNDLMAFGVIDALKHRGIRVPDDVSVHGFDDIQAAFFYSPPLTTIALPLHEMGEMAADSVINMCGSESETVNEKSILIPCTHVKRESVKQVTSKQLLFPLSNEECPRKG